MAGTIPNLPLSQQFDKTTGKFLAGGRLYFFVSNTDQPQSAYQDSALTAALPNPIELDDAGRCPMFYIADGTIRVRLENQRGTVQFDERNLLVIGPSGGGGGGGTPVDVNALFQTGDPIWSFATGARSGFVRANARTIGSAVSGASERANSDCQSLFVLGWGLGWTVVGSAGASATADWAANKQITLPDMRGRAAFGLDDQGNAAASRLVGATFATGNATTAGSVGGEASHVLTVSEAPKNITTLNFADSHHQHPAPSGGQFVVNGAGTSNLVGGGGLGLVDHTESAAAGITASLTDNAGGNSHNNMSPFMLGTWYVKL